MLRIPFFALFVTFSTLTDAVELLGQRSLITARAVLPPRQLFGRQDQFTCAQATDTVCPDGSGCCPNGAGCFSSGGVGLCSVTCEAAQPTCVFNGITACCPVGDTCGGSLCIPATGLPVAAASSSTSEAPITTPAAVLSSSSDASVASPSYDSASASSSSSSDSSSSTEASSSVESSSVPSSLSSDGFILSNGTGYSIPPVVSISVSGGGGVATSVTTSTSTLPAGGNTNTFALSPSATTSGPLQVSVAAAPTLGAWNPVVNLVGLAALGLVI